LRRFNDEPIIDLTGKSGLNSWPITIQLSESSFNCVFRTDNSITNWGYSFIIEPIYTEDVGGCLPDSQLMELPSVEFLMETIMIESIRKYSPDRKRKISANLLYLIEHKIRTFSTEEITWIFKVLSILIEYDSMNPVVESRVETMIYSLVESEKDDVNDGIQLSYSTLVQNMLEVRVSR